MDIEVGKKESLIDRRYKPSKKFLELPLGLSSVVLSKPTQFEGAVEDLKEEKKNA